MSAFTACLGLVTAEAEAWTPNEGTRKYTTPGRDRRTNERRGGRRPRGWRSLPCATQAPIPWPPSLVAPSGRGMAVPTRGAPNDVRQLKEFLPNVNIFMQSCLVAVSKPLRLSATDAVCSGIAGRGDAQLGRAGLLNAGYWLVGCLDSTCHLGDRPSVTATATPRRVVAAP